MGRYSHISFAKRPRAYSNLAAVAAISTAVGSLSWCSAFVGLSARGTPSRLTGDTIGRSVAVVDAVVTKEVTEVDDVPTWATGRFPGVKPELIPHEPVKDRQFVDEEAIRELHPFPIPSEDLVELTKAFLNDKFSCDEPGNPRMARNFRFIAPVVPAVGSGLSAEKFCDAFGQFDLMVMVPDLDPQQYDFRTDPFEPNRVWFTARGKGTNSGKVFGALPATGKSFEGPPQTSSCTFNEQGEVTKFTIGYVMDKEVGNTGGLGGIYGILYAIGYGLPFPEARPWKASPFYRLFFQGGGFVSNLRDALR